jgi:diguanylate cyclase (GGDEF)-like protein/PAS domain S-box-containing protein
VPWAVAGAVLIIGLIAAATLTRAVVTTQDDQATREAESAAGQVVQQLEASVVPPVSLTHALRTFVLAQDGDLDPVTTRAFIRDLANEADFVTAMSIAPNNRIEYLSPARGNEAALGLDLTSIPEQWEPLRDVIASGRPALLGPFPLVQGGLGLAYREPVFLPSGEYWGLASTVVDAEAFLTAAVNAAGIDPSRVAVRTVAEGAAGEPPFWGVPDAFSSDAIVLTAEPEGTAWEVGVVVQPEGGNLAFLVGAFGAVASLLLALVTYLAVQLQQRRREVTHRLERLSDQAPGVLYQMRVRPDGSASVSYISGRVEEVLGISVADAVTVPGILTARVHPDDRDRARSALLDAAGKGRPWSDRIRMTAADGSQHWFQTEVSPEVLPSGDTVLHGHLTDITDTVLAEDRLRISASVFEATRDGVILMDPEGVITDVNPGFTDITGFTLEDVAGESIEMLGVDVNPPGVYADVRTTLARTGFWQGALLQRAKGGSVSAQAVTITAVRGSTYTVDHYVAVLSALSTLQDDFVTGLPGRLVLDDRIVHALEHAASDSSQVALLIVSLDRFGDVNAALGHHRGDLVLKEVARRLRALIREPQTVARFSGDEFAVVLTPDVTVETATATAVEIAQEITEPIHLEESDVRLTASTGIAMSSADARTSSDLITSASQAAQAAKAAGRGRFLFFTPQMQQETRQRARLTEDLHHAIPGDQLSILFQPVVDLVTNRTVKAEALVRWVHPTLGPISPEVFVPLAEASDQVKLIGDWMFAQVLQLLPQARLVLPDFRVSINLSPVEIVDATDLHARRILRLRESGVPGEALIAEITEGLMLDRNGATARTLQTYRDAGFGFAIDDFGTGYASLAYLQSLDVDFVKIDQSFVRGISADERNITLCRAIIQMSHGLGLRVIAEGVESTKIRDILAEQGCDFGQGYLFAAPLTPDELLQRLRDERDA